MKNGVVGTTKRYGAFVGLPRGVGEVFEFEIGLQKKSNQKKREYISFVTYL